MRTITGNAGAWISNAEMFAHKDKADPINYSFAPLDTDMSGFGWAKAGTATLSVELLDDQQLAAGQVAALTEAKRLILAKAGAHVAEIEGRIQSLLALPAPVQS